MSPTTGHTVSTGRRTLTLGKLLKSGGAGSIYLLPDSPDSVAKIYHPGFDPVAAQRKIEAMLNLVPELPHIDEGERRLVQMAWPTAALRDVQGRFCGFLMPVVDVSATSELETVLQERQAREAGLPTGLGAKMTLAANLSAVVAELHRHGHHMVDLKPVNLRFYKQSLYLALLDCDGFSVKGETERFHAPQVTPDYLAPEFQRGEPMDTPEKEQAQDCFALAAVIFQLLNFGIHPFNGRPQSERVPSDIPGRIQGRWYAHGLKPRQGIQPVPGSGHALMPMELREPFDRAFGGSTSRPSAAEWADLLKPHANRSSHKLVICSRDESHQHFAAMACAACERDAMRQRAVAAAVPLSHPEPPQASTPAPPNKKSTSKRRQRKQKPAAPQTPQPTAPLAWSAQAPVVVNASAGSAAQPPVQSKWSAEPWVVCVLLVFLGIPLIKSCTSVPDRAAEAAPMESVERAREKQRIAASAPGQVSDSASRLHREGRVESEAFNTALDVLLPAAVRADAVAYREAWDGLEMRAPREAKNRVRRDPKVFYEAMDEYRRLMLSPEFRQRSGQRDPSRPDPVLQSVELLRRAVEADPFRTDVALELVLREMTAYRAMKMGYDPTNTENLPHAVRVQQAQDDLLNRLAHVLRVDLSSADAWAGLAAMWVEMDQPDLAVGAYVVHLDKAGNGPSHFQAVLGITVLLSDLSRQRWAVVQARAVRARALMRDEPVTPEMEAAASVAWPTEKPKPPAAAAKRRAPASRKHAS